MLQRQTVKNQRGQTLWELIIIVVVIAVGLSIAIPYYVSYKRQQESQQKIEQLEKQLEEERNKRERASQLKISQLETEINDIRKTRGLKPKTWEKEPESSTANTIAWWFFVFALLVAVAVLGHKGLNDYHKRKVEQQRVDLKKWR